MEWLREAAMFAENSAIGVVSASASLVGCRDYFCKTLPHYNSKSCAEKIFPDWMSAISDDIPICAVTIPGTHNTCSLYGGDLVICQSLDLRQQLQAGIRFLDIRLRHFRDCLPIHHEFVYQNKDFTSVLEDVTEFLEKHPSEFVLMQIQGEYRSAENTTEFDQLVYTVCMRFAQFFPSGGVDGRTDPKNTTVKEVRGKICVMQNYRGISVPGAIDHNWVDQNKWDMTWDQIKYVKIPSIREHFGRARNTEGVLHRNWLSAASASAWPHRVAMKTNQVGLECLQTLEYSRNGLGIVIADFPGSGLIEECIRHSEGTVQFY